MVNERRFQELIKELDHPDYQVRRLAAYALGQLGEVRAVVPLIKALYELDPKDENNRVNRHAQAALVELGEPSILPLINEIKEKKVINNSWRIYWSATTLKKLGKSALEKLIGELEHADPEVRQIIVEVLGYFEERVAFDTLISSLKDEDTQVSSTSVEVLGKLGKLEALTALENLLNSSDGTVSQNQKFKNDLIEAIIKINQQNQTDQFLRQWREIKPREERIRLLMETLLQHSSWFIRMSAATELGWIDDEQVLSTLRWVAQNDLSTAVRKIALQSAKEIERRLKVDQKLHQKHTEHKRSRIEKLLLQLNSPEESVRMRAVYFLGLYGDESVLPTLTEIEKKDPIAEVKVTASNSIARIRSKQHRF